MKQRYSTLVAEVGLVVVLLSMVLITLVFGFQQRDNDVAGVTGAPETQPSTFASVEPTYGPTPSIAITNIPKPGETGIPTPFPTVIVPYKTPPPVQDKPTPLPVTPLPTPKPSDPWGYVVYGEPAPRDIMLERSDIVVVATVTEIKPARWTTPDGKRPANPHASDNRFTIIHPVVIQVEKYLLGIQTALTIEIDVPGGIIGQDSVLYENYGLYDFREGEHIVAFITKPIPGKFGYGTSTHYTIDKDGVLKNDIESIRLQQLIDDISKLTTSR